MVTLTPKAVEKVKAIFAEQSPVPVALRVGVRGGGCSGFQYALVYDYTNAEETDEVLNFDGLAVYVDQMSMMYLDGVTIDYVERLDESGFKFENPNVKTTCGCGQSFNV